MAEDPTNIPDVSMAEVEAVLSSEIGDESAIKDGLTRTVLLGRALAAAEHMCTSMRKEQTSPKDGIMFLHPLLKIIAKLLSQIPETSLTAGVTISETIIGILGSIVGKHSDDVESASTIVDASFTVALSAVTSASASAIEKLDPNMVHEIIHVVTQDLAKAVASGDAPTVAMCFKALFAIVTRCDVGYSVVTSSDRTVKLLPLTLKACLDIFKQKKASRSADNEHSALRTVGWLAQVATAIDFDKATVKALKSAAKGVLLPESKAVANDLLSFAALIQKVGTPKYKLPSTSKGTDNVLLVGGNLETIQNSCSKSETAALIATDDFESIEEDVSKCSNGIVVVAIDDHRVQANLKICARVRVASKCGSTVLCAYSGPPPPLVWVSTACHGHAEPMSVALNDDVAVAAALKPFCRVPVEAGTSTAAESEHVMTAIAAGDVVPTSPVDASIVSLEEFEALQDKVASQTELIDTLQSGLQERIDTAVKALLQPLEQRLTASEERAVSLEKDLIDSQSEIARLDAMLYKLKVSGGGAGDGAGADQGQSPQPPRSKVTSPNSEGRVPKPGELSARSQMAAVMRGNMLAGMRKGNIAPAAAEDGVDAERAVETVPPQGTTASKEVSSSVAPVASDGPPGGAGDGGVAEDATEESGGDRASTLHEVFGEGS